MRIREGDGDAPWVSDYFPTRQGGGNEWAAIASLNNVLYYIGGVLLVKVKILKQC